MPQPKPDDNAYTDMPVGEILKRAREHYGQSLEQVEVNLRIRAEQISAIEHGDMDKLPGKAYAIGFVRAYSEYLGFNSDQMVQLLKTQGLRNKKDPDLNFPVAASDSKLPTIAVVALSLILLIGFIMWWSSSKDAQHTEANTIPAAAETGAESSQSSFSSSTVNSDGLKDMRIYQAPIGPPAPDPKTAASAQNADGGKIMIRVKQNSWVEIRDQNGKALVSRVLKAGEQYSVPNRPDLKMALGNAGGIELSVGGTVIPALGASGEVVKNISLDAKALKALAE